jgi:hypothetical protein
VNQLDPRNFRVEREDVDIPPEDYNEEANYGFGMQHATIYAGMLASVAIAVFIGYCFMKVFFV